MGTKEGATKTLLFDFQWPLFSQHGEARGGQSLLHSGEARQSVTGTPRQSHQSARGRQRHKRQELESASLFSAFPRAAISPCAKLAVVEPVPPPYHSVKTQSNLVFCKIHLTGTWRSKLL